MGLKYCQAYVVRSELKKIGGTCAKEKLERVPAFFSKKAGIWLKCCWDAGCQRVTSTTTNPPKAASTVTTDGVRRSISQTFV